VTGLLGVAAPPGSLGSLDRRTKTLRAVGPTVRAGACPCSPTRGAGTIPAVKVLTARLWQGSTDAATGAEHFVQGDRPEVALAEQLQHGVEQPSDGEVISVAQHHSAGLQVAPGLGE